MDLKNKSLSGKEYPFRLEDESICTGPFENYMYGIVGLVGAIAGWKFGTQAIEYAQQITENAGVLTHMVKESPLITHLVTSWVGLRAGKKIGEFSGKYIDKMAGTHHPLK